MKKSSILLTTALCGSFLFLGCTNTTPTANISKSLEHNLTVLTNTINRLDTIDNSYLSNPDIYPITTTVNAPAPDSNHHLLAKIDFDDMYRSNYKNKICISNLNLNNNIDSYKTKNIKNENRDTIKNYTLEPVKYSPRYNKYQSENENYLDSYIGKVRNLYAITNDAMEANTTFNNCKTNVLSYCEEIKQLNYAIEDGYFAPSNQQIAALNNYIDDIKITIKRIKKCNGDLTDEVNTINKGDSNGITTGIDVINSNYISVLNHLDTRITYLKNALVTLEQIKDILIETQKLSVDNNTNIDTIVDDENNNSNNDVNTSDDNNSQPINNSENVDNQGENQLNDVDNIETNNSDNNANNNDLLTDEIDNKVDINENHITDKQEVVNNTNLNNSNINDNNNVYNENLDDETSNIETTENTSTETETKEKKETNIDTYLNTNNNLDTYKNNNNIENNCDDCNNLNNQTNCENNNQNDNINLNNNNLGNCENNNIPYNNNFNGTYNNIPNNSNINGNLNTIPLPNDVDRINTPNGTFQNGIITQNNLNNGVNNGVNGNHTGMGSSNNYPYVNGDLNRTNKNIDTYGYNTMIDMLNRGTVNNGINTLELKESVNTKPAMVNNESELTTEQIELTNADKKEEKIAESDYNLNEELNNDEDYSVELL